MACPVIARDPPWAETVAIPCNAEWFGIASSPKADRNDNCNFKRRDTLRLFNVGKFRIR